MGERFTGSSRFSFGSLGCSLPRLRVRGPDGPRSRGRSAAVPRVFRSLAGSGRRPPEGALFRLRTGALADRTAPRQDDHLSAMSLASGLPVQAAKQTLGGAPRFSISWPWSSRLAARLRGRAANLCGEHPVADLRGLSATCLPVTWTRSALRLLGPRPTRRRLFSSPGLAACLAVFPRRS